jgi:hypothetical protein
MNPKGKQALQIVGILKISFIVVGLLFLCLIFKIPPSGSAPPQPAFELIISAIALTNIGLGFILPGFIASVARRGESSARPSTTPIQRWMSGYVISLALFQSCNIFGLVLHFIGARALVVESLFAAGLLAMLVWSPGTPPTDEEVSPMQMFPKT